MTVVDGRVFALVPARSGSTRIPHKNLQEVGGRTLLGRAVDTALAAFGRCWVSTDSADYASAAQRAGALVPDLRPGEFAGAESPVDEAIAHALAWAPPQAEVLVLIQPTSPFTTPDDLTAVVAALDSTSAACALTASSVPATTAFVMTAHGDGTGHFLVPGALGLRTQDLGALAVPTGAAYAARITRLVAGETLVREPVALVHVTAERAIDIDDPEDLALARSVAL